MDLRKNSDGQLILQMMSFPHSRIRPDQPLNCNDNIQAGIELSSQPNSTLRIGEDFNFASTGCVSNREMLITTDISSSLNPLASTFTPLNNTCISSTDSPSTSTDSISFSMDSSTNMFSSLTNIFGLSTNLYNPSIDFFDSPMDAFNTPMNSFPDVFSSSMDFFDLTMDTFNLSSDTCSTSTDITSQSGNSCSNCTNSFGPSNSFYNPSIDAFTPSTSTLNPTANSFRPFTNELCSPINRFGSSTDVFDSSTDLSGAPEVLRPSSEPSRKSKSRKYLPSVQGQPMTPTSSNSGLNFLKKAPSFKETKTTVSKKTKMEFSNESRSKVPKVTTIIDSKELTAKDYENSKTEIVSEINKTTVTKSTNTKVLGEDPGIRVLPNADQLQVRPNVSFKECEGCESKSKKVFKAGASRRGTAVVPKHSCLDFSHLKSNPGFIDSHCHLDILFQRQNFEGTYADYIRRHRDSYPISYEGCVTVFCNPFSFQQVEVWQKFLNEKGVWGAFGCHPHNARYYDDARETELCYALEHTKVRALGEIGLDYSNRNDVPKETQHEVMRRQLHIAMRRRLPLVIHCRDANDDCMKIMKEILPRDYAIHLHCFTEGWNCAQEWLKEFPNLWIGLTNLVTFNSAKSTHDVAKRISLKRLLLETDAPYFIPKKGPRSYRFSHPGMAIHVASQIATLRDMPLAEVLHWTRQNTHKLYGI